MIRECTAGDVERIKRWTEAEGGRSLLWLAMLDDVTAEVILEAAVWRIAGRDGQQLKGAPLSCGSSRPGPPGGMVRCPLPAKRNTRTRTQKARHRFLHRQHEWATP